jgi:hypothetical protein
MSAQSTTTANQARTAPARKQYLRNAALRATEDPVRLARAARIVRAAIERGRLSAADLDPDQDHADRDAVRNGAA